MLSVACKEKNGNYRGLVAICKNLGLIKEAQPKLLLPQLREILSTHVAFQDNNTHLEKLAAKYNINIIWCPKFHCELNPIEGFWCDIKRYIRKHNDQDFNKLNFLISESIEQYKNKNLNIKLWFRFWEALNLYKDGFTYEQVLQELFGVKSSAKIVQHKKNKDFNNVFSI